jgi:ferrochelatase
VSAAAPAVLLANLGGPEGPADVAPFIERMLSDPRVVPLPWPLRRLLARLVARRRAPRVVEHYRAIGGGSPVRRHTEAQGAALAALLGDEVAAVRTVLRYSPPRAAAVLADLAAGGVREAVAVPLYPQWSSATGGSALAEIDAAAARAGIAVRPTPSFPSAPGWIAALAELALPHLEPGCHVLLTAHGLPQRIVDRGDPYVAEVRATAAALARALPAGTRTSLAFQSRLGPAEWTRPYLVDEVRRLAGDGVRSLVVVPLSFVCENLETLYELDIEVAALAAAAGVERYRRVAAVGCHPAFVACLAELVRGAMARRFEAADAA